MVARLKASGDPANETELGQKIVACGPSASSALAWAALDFRPDDPRTHDKFYFTRTALALIGEIGILSENHASSIHAWYLRGRTLQDAVAGNWGGVYRQAQETLEKVKTVPNITK